MTTSAHHEGSHPPVLTGGTGGCRRIGADINIRVREVTLRQCPHCGSDLRAWSRELPQADGAPRYRLRPINSIALATEDKNGLQRGEIIAWSSFVQGVTHEWFGPGHPFIGGWLTCDRACVVKPTIYDALRENYGGGESPIL